METKQALSSLEALRGISSKVLDDLAFAFAEEELQDGETAVDTSDKPLCFVVLEGSITYSGREFEAGAMVICPSQRQRREMRAHGKVRMARLRAPAYALLMGTRSELSDAFRSMVGGEAGLSHRGCRRPSVRASHAAAFL
jgi:hypothetical protein